jgi:hypothetical protein
MIAEHCSNSFPPQHPSQCGQRIVRAFAFGFRKRQNAGDGTSAGAQYPAGNQVDENPGGRLSKNGRKVRDYGIPGRYLSARLDNDRCNLGRADINPEN